MYTETCPDCLGVGTITHRKMMSVHLETVNCKKCQGEKLVHYKESPQRRETMRKYKAKNRVTIPVRWTPPEKIPEEYEF